jgi:hypothetical protein
MEVETPVIGVEFVEFRSQKIGFILRSAISNGLDQVSPSSSLAVSVHPTASLMTWPVSSSSVLFRPSSSFLVHVSR